MLYIDSKISKTIGIYASRFDYDNILAWTPLLKNYRPAITTCSFLRVSFGSSARIVKSIPFFQVRIKVSHSAISGPCNGYFFFYAPQEHESSPWLYTVDLCDKLTIFHRRKSINFHKISIDFQ